MYVLKVSARVQRVWALTANFELSLGFKAQTVMQSLSETLTLNPKRSEYLIMEHLIRQKADQAKEPLLGNMGDSQN